MCGKCDYTHGLHGQRTLEIASRMSWKHVMIQQHDIITLMCSRLRYISYSVVRVAHTLRASTAEVVWGTSTEEKHLLALAPDMISLQRIISLCAAGSRSLYTPASLVSTAAVTDGVRFQPVRTRWEGLIKKTDQ